MAHSNVRLYFGLCIFIFVVVTAVIWLTLRPANLNSSTRWLPNFYGNGTLGKHTERPANKLRKITKFWYWTIFCTNIDHHTRAALDNRIIATHSIIANTGISSHLDWLHRSITCTTGRYLIILMRVHRFVIILRLRAYSRIPRIYYNTILVMHMRTAH